MGDVSVDEREVSVRRRHRQPADSGGPEQRVEERYPVSAAAIVERADGRRISAHCVNASGGGMLLDLTQPSDISVGEVVVCALQLYSQKPPQIWGKGRVVRVTASLIAVHFN